jgi:formate dehydrogenase major subunit
VAATFLKQAAKNGAKLIVMDPRGQELMRHAYSLQFKPGTDVALLNAMLNVIVTEELYDRQYIAGHVDGFEALKEKIRDFTPEAMAPVCGIDAETLREVARTLRHQRSARSSSGAWASPSTPRHRQRALPDRAGADHRPDRPPGHGPASAARPEQRAGRVRRRPDPDGLPGLPVGGRPEYPCRVRGCLGPDARSERGLTVVEIMDAVLAGGIEACTSWARTRPCPTRTSITPAPRCRSSKHLVVQDIFLTETAWHADVILPASAHAEKLGTFTNTNRQVQIGRPCVPPPGEAREDWRSS